MTAQAILWRRLDQPGHESGRLFLQHSYWHLIGTAVFAHNQQPCRLDYVVVCNAGWQTLCGRVTGWVGNETLRSSSRLMLRAAGGLMAQSVPQWQAASTLTLASARPPTCCRFAGWVWPSDRRQRCRRPGLASQVSPSSRSNSFTAALLSRPIGTRVRAAGSSPNSR